MDDGVDDIRGLLHAMTVGITPSKDPKNISGASDETRSSGISEATPPSKRQPDSEDAETAQRRLSLDVREEMSKHCWYRVTRPAALSDEWTRLNTALMEFDLPPLRPIALKVGLLVAMAQC
jgi:hypothetical protein